MNHCLALVLLASCVVGDSDEDTEEDLINTTALTIAATKPGVNGEYCTASAYNCRFRQGSSRVVTKGGLESWGISPGASIRDGNGNVLGTETATRLTFNYGQTRLLAGTAHALALTTANRSAGWYPIDRILGELSFRQENGEVNGKDPGEGSLACYAVVDSADESLAAKKVVFDAQTANERAGDYLPLVRANGQRSANLVFSVPGFGLGGATTDHFPAGTKFQRVSVPTASGVPSISIPLWVKDGSGAYMQRSGSLRFLYGYVRAADNVKRFGWMAQPALAQATGCN